MKLQEGYITDYDTLRALPVADLETVMLRIDRDGYLPDHTKAEIMEEYVSARKDVLDSRLAYSPEVVEKVKRLNDVIIRDVTEMLTLAWRIYCDMSGRCGWRSFDVEALLLPPAAAWDEEDCDEGGGVLFLTEKETMVWSILCDKDKNRSLGNLATRVGLAYPREDGGRPEEKLREVLYELDPDREPTSWIDVMSNVPREPFEGTLFVWPLHTLYDHCGFAMSDLLKIERFRYEIKVEEIKP